MSTTNNISVPDSLPQADLPPVNGVCPRLLFIDDDPRAQQTLQMVLSDSYDVVSSYTGRSGVERVREEDPDLVLLDINLPDQDGFKSLEQIVSIPASPPVVMLTVYLIYNDLVKNDSIDYRRRYTLR